MERTPISFMKPAQLNTIKPDKKFIVAVATIRKATVWSVPLLSACLQLPMSTISLGDKGPLQPPLSFPLLRLPLHLCQMQVLVAQTHSPAVHKQFLPSGARGGIFVYLHRIYQFREHIKALKIIPRKL